MYEFLGGLPVNWFIVLCLCGLSVVGFLTFIDDRRSFKKGFYNIPLAVSIAVIFGGVILLLLNIPDAISTYGEDELFGGAIFRSCIGVYLIEKGASWTYWSVKLRNKRLEEDEKLRRQLLGGDENEWKRPRRDDDSSPER